MEVVTTFGSLGDIISVCQIAVQLSRALGVGCTGASGSVEEYRDLRKELDTLVQVVATYEQHTSPALSSLDTVTWSVIHDCHVGIKQTLDTLVPRYHDALAPGGYLRSEAKRAFKKVEWFVREKDRLRKLRERIQRNTERLSMLLWIVARNSTRVDNATLLSRIEEVRAMIMRQDKYQQVMLDFMRRHEVTYRQLSREITATGRRVETQERKNRSISDSVRAILIAVVELADMLGNIANGIVYLQVLLSNSRIGRTLNPTKGMPVVLEDAMGSETTLPLEILPDWQSLYVIVEILFKGRKGHDMARGRQFILEEQCTGKEISQLVPLSFSLRRGMKISMNMVFVKYDSDQASCPRCRRAADAPRNVRIQCQTAHCGMSFRLLDFERLDTGEFSPEETGSTNVWHGIEQELTCSRDHNGVLGLPVEPSDFQRVRIVNLNPGSWKVQASEKQHEGQEIRCRVEDAVVRDGVTKLDHRIAVWTCCQCGTICSLIWNIRCFNLSCQHRFCCTTESLRS